MSGKHDAKYYLKCMIGGALACGLTHTTAVPINVLRVKRQIDIKFSTGIIDGLKKIYTSGHITLGWAPTLIGYSFLGLGLFGFYEIFKDIYKGILGENNAKRFNKTGWFISAGLARILGDCLLCPWEALRLKIQLSRPGY